MQGGARYEVFSEMPYARPDTETVKKQLTKLTERLKNAGTYEGGQGGLPGGAEGVSGRGDPGHTGIHPPLHRYP